MCPFVSERTETYSVKDNPLLQWMPDRRVYLEELIRLEGRGIFTDEGQCELCRKDGQYRCLDCVAVQFLCSECTCSVHSFNPFHVVEVSPHAL